MCWLYVPGTEGSTSAYVLPDPKRGSSVTLKGRPLRWPGLLWLWTQGSSIQLLSGLTCEPSTLARGVERFIASLGDIPASLSATPADAGESPTPGTSGPSSATSSNAFAPSGPFSRTSLATYRWDLKPSSRTYRDWATRLRAACLLRRKWARAIDGNESSSWPTPNATDGDKAPRFFGRGNPSLPHAAKTLWPTPTASDQNIYAKAPENRTDKTRKQQIALNDVAVLWSTPRASDGEKGGPNQSFGAGGTPLPSQAALWATPAATDGDKAPRFHKGGNPSLPEQARSCPFFPQDLETSTPGGPSSTPAPTSPRRRLNPEFVEWLMGWPSGYTAFAASATEWSRYRQRMRGAFSKLPSPWKRPH